jgi:hypothetical protein
MTADEAIAAVKSAAVGRTRYEGQPARIDEILVAEIERLREAAKHERDIGAEAVLLQARSMANVELSEENDRLIEALRDAYVLIDNDLVGPWIARHQLDWLTANNKSM